MIRKAGLSFATILLAGLSASAKVGSNQPSVDQVDRAMLAGALADHGRTIDDPIILAAAARVAAGSDAVTDTYAPDALASDTRQAVVDDPAFAAVIERALPQSRRGIVGVGSSGENFELTPHGTRSWKLDCAAKEPMKASVRVIGNGSGARLLQIEVASAVGARAQGSSAFYGQTVSWLPRARGLYVVTVRNLSGEKLLVQYAATRN